MLIRIPFDSRTPIKTSEVNRLPWLVLKIAGTPQMAIASSSADMQNSASMVFETRHESIFRE
jgi:hypothetical protein